MRNEKISILYTARVPQEWETSNMTTYITIVSTQATIVCTLLDDLIYVIHNVTIKY